MALPWGVRVRRWARGYDIPDERAKRRVWVPGRARSAGTCFLSERFADVWSSCLAVFRARRQREAGKVMSWLALVLALPAPFVHVLHVGLPSLRAFWITTHTHTHERILSMHLRFCKRHKWIEVTGNGWIKNMGYDEMSWIKAWMKEDVS